VRNDEPELAGYSRIEERELEAGGLNWVGQSKHASGPPLRRTGRCNVERMRIAGVRLGAPVARQLSEILRSEGYRVAADKIVDAIERQVTIEAPLTLDDHQAILEALSRNCPTTLYRLRQRLDEERRYARRVTGA
jgi:hypothetical protein